MKRLLYILIAIPFCLTSCIDTDQPDVDMEATDNIIDRITVFLAKRATEGSGVGAIDSERLDSDEDQDKLIPYELKFDSNSVIFVSQQTELVPPFQSEEGIYAYKYIEDSEADWYEGYNFTPRSVTNPLEWFKIGNAGSYRAGFALYALYFPGRDEIEQREESGKIIYSVEEDQSNLENLMKSDILGAFHSNPTLFTRLNFRLFHLMTYLRIRLYVPVYDNKSKTGFYAESLQSANLENVTPEFAVEWSSTVSSDTEGPTISPLNGEGNIIMYQHPLPPGKSEREIVKIKYENFVPKDYFEQPIEGEYDDVRVYEFSVIMPMQKGTVKEDGTESSFTQTNFLNFNLRSNSGAINRYVFNQSKTANSTGSNLQLNQGIFQYMELYVPRVGNKVIYVGATLNAWKKNETSFPLTTE